MMATLAGNLVSFDDLIFNVFKTLCRFTEADDHSARVRKAGSVPAKGLPYPAFVSIPDVSFTQLLPYQNGKFPFLAG